MEIAILVGGVLGTIAPLIAMYFALKQNADEGYETDLEKRVEKMSRDLEVAAERIVELKEENLRLMRKLLANGK